MNKSPCPTAEVGSEGPQSTPHTVPQGPQQYLPLLGQLLMKQRSATPEDRQFAATDRTHDTNQAVATLLQRLAAAAQRPQQQVQEQQQQQVVESVQLPAPAFGGVAPLLRPAAPTGAAGLSSSTIVARSQPTHQQQLQQQQRDVPISTRKPAGPSFKQPQQQQQQQALGAKLRMKPGKHLAAAAALEARQSGAAAASIAQWRRKPLNLNAAKTPGRLSGPVPSPRRDAPPRVPATFPQQQQQQQWPTSGHAWPDPAAAAATAADAAVPGQITSSSHFLGGVGVSYTTESPVPVLSPPSIVKPSALGVQGAGVQRVTHVDSMDSYIGIQPSGPQVAAAAAGGSGVQIRSDLIRSGGGSQTYQQIMHELGHANRDQGQQQQDLDQRSDLGSQIRDLAHRSGQPSAAASAVKVEPASPGLLPPSVITTPAAAAAATAAAAAASGEAGSDLSGLELLVDAAAAAAVLAPEASALPQKQQQQQHPAQQQQPQPQQQQQHHCQGQQQQLLHMKDLQNQLQQLQAEFWQQQQQQQQQQGPAAAAATVHAPQEQQQQQWSLQEQHQRLQHIQQRLAALRAQVQQPAAAAPPPHQPMVLQQQQQQQGVSQAHAGSLRLPIGSNLGDWLSQLTTLLQSGINVQHRGLPQDHHITAAAAAAAAVEEQEEQQQQQQQQQHNDTWQGIYQPAALLHGSNAPRSRNPPDIPGSFALPFCKPTLHPPTVIYPYSSSNPIPDLVTKPDILNPSSSGALNRSTSNPSSRVTSHAEQLQQLQQLSFQLKQLSDLRSDLAFQLPVDYAETIMSQPPPLDMTAFRNVLADILETHKEAKALLQQAANLGLITRTSQQQAAAAAAVGDLGIQPIASEQQQQQQQQGVLVALSGDQTAAAAAAAAPVAELRLPKLLPRDAVALQDITAQPAAAAADADLDQQYESSATEPAAAAAAPLAAAAAAAESHCANTAEAELEQPPQFSAPEPAAAAAAELHGADTADVDVDQLLQDNAAEPQPAAAAAPVAAAAAEQRCVDIEDGDAHHPPLKRRRTDGLTAEQEPVPTAVDAQAAELAAAAPVAAAEGEAQGHRDTETAGDRIDQRAFKRYRTDVEAQHPKTAAAAAAAAAGEQSASAPAKPSAVTADSQPAAAAAADPVITAEPKPHDLQFATQPELCSDGQQQQQQQDCAKCVQEQEGQPPPVLPQQQQQQQGDTTHLGGASSVQQADQPQQKQKAGLHQQQQQQEHDEAATAVHESRVAHQPAATSAATAAAAAAGIELAAAGTQQPQPPASSADHTLAVTAAPAVDWDASADLLGRIAAVLSKMQRHMHGLAFLAIPCAADLLLVRRTAADLVRQIAADLDTQPPAAAAAAEGPVAPDSTQQGDRQTTLCLNVLRLHVTSLQQQAAMDRATVADQQQQISDLQQQLAAAQQQQRQQARLVAAAVTQMMGVVNSTAGLSDQDRMSLITAGAELLQSML